VLLLSSAAPWLVFKSARAAGLEGGAWAAAWLVATGLLHVHFSIQERPWGPLVTFFALSAWPAIVHAREGALRPLVLSGAAAGLAFACHQAGLLALLIPGIAWFAAPTGWSGEQLLRRAKTGFATVGVFALIGFVVGHPYLLVHGATPSGQVAAAEQLEGDLSIGGQAIIFAVSFESFARLARTFFGYDPVLVLFALIGILPALRNRRLLPVTLFGLGWAAFFMTNQNDHVRYLLPLSVLLAWPAGLAVEKLWQTRSAGVRFVVLGLLAFPFVQTVRFAWVLRQADTRQLAKTELERFPSARIAVDCYGPALPKTAAALERIARWRPLGSRERHRLDQVQAGAREDSGFDVVPIEDLFDFDYRAGTSRVERGRETLGDEAQSILSGLLVDYVLLVDRDPTDGQPPLLVDSTPPANGGEKLAPLALAPEPEFVIHPGREPNVACEGRLPTEMQFPLTGLWRVERPGPRLELFRLLR